MAKQITLPQDFYLVRDEDGIFHWYTKDPMTNNRSNAELTTSDIEMLISESIGWGRVENPVVLQISGRKIERSLPLDIGLLSRTYKEKHLQLKDLTGNIVKPLPESSANPYFPLAGEVYDENGNEIGQRLYTYKGECSDGENDHRVVVVLNAVDFV